MQSVTVTEIKRSLLSHESTGMHVDPRLLHEVEQPGEMFLERLEARDQFLRLIWQSIDAARPIVPQHQPRTLADCASRLSDFEWDFGALVAAGFPWFQSCVEIDKNFDYTKLGVVAVTIALPSELRETPQGMWYIYDGVHKSIVLAKKLICSEIEYKPVELLILTPRRR